jgi:hypothetical protein
LQYVISASALTLIAVLLAVAEMRRLDRSPLRAVLDLEMEEDSAVRVAEGFLDVGGDLMDCQE